MKQIKAFFEIESNKFEFETFDFTCLLTILNVVLVFIGAWYAPIFGLISCVACLVWNITHKSHINSYITQIALIALNIKFLM